MRTIVVALLLWFSSACAAGQDSTADADGAASGDVGLAPGLVGALAPASPASNDDPEGQPGSKEAMGAAGEAGDDAAWSSDASTPAVAPPLAPPPSLPPFDAGEGGLCAPPRSAGDLIIDELMIESVAGSGDHGEWLEATSTLGCALDLKGLRGEAPSGNKVRSFEIDDDVWVPAFGTLVVADSGNATINHSLPGPIVAWSGQAGDVLRNKGTTVTLRMNDVLVDSVTYPAMALTVGASLAFPSDCPASRRSDWTAWQVSTSSWFPGFLGTPNASNVDVHCM